MPGVCVQKGSGDDSSRVDAGGDGVYGAGDIEQVDYAVGGAQEPMIRVGKIVVVSDDFAARVDGGGERPRTARRGGKGDRIEGGEVTIAGPHEPTVIAPEGVFIHRNGFKVGSRDLPGWVDGWGYRHEGEEGKPAKRTPGASRRIQRAKGARPRSQEVEVGET